MLQTWGRPPAPVRPVADLGELTAASALVEEVHIEERVLRYAVRLVKATREHGRVALGASPRATLGLSRMARAWALLHGRDYATPDDLRAVLGPTLEHRVMVTTDAAIVRGTPVQEPGRTEVRLPPPSAAGSGAR
jgi:MoxR-like ATPase